MADKDFEILLAEDAQELVSNMEPNCLVDPLSAYLKSCDPFSITNPEPSDNHDEPILSRTDALVDPLTSIVLPESSELRDNDGKDNIINEIKQLSTRRSTRNTSSNQKTDTKLAARKSRRTSGKKLILDLLAADVGRKRRSDLARRARSLTWGLGGIIDEIFKQNAENNVDLNEQSRKGRTGRRNGKKNTDYVNQSVQNSQGASQALNRSLLLKLKLGTKAVQNCQINRIPDMDKYLDSYREAPALQSDIKNSLEEDLMSRASNENLDKQMVSLKSSVIDVLLAEKEKSEILENRCLDPGTSPDSEVINVIPETQICGTSTEGLHENRASSRDSIYNQSGDCPEIINDVLLCDKFDHNEKQIDGSCSSGASMSLSTGVSLEPMTSLHETEVGVSMDMLTIESVTKADVSIIGIGSVESSFSEKLNSSAKSNGQNLQKTSNLGLNKKKTSTQKNGPLSNSTAKGKNKSSGKDQVDCDTESQPITGILETNDVGGLEEGSRSTDEPLSNSTMVPGEGESRPRSAWVCCDVCHKWRRISAILADYIGSTECKWICKDNVDKSFADCSIPQEKSNADINEELELSDASCEEDACNTRLNSSQLGQQQRIGPPQSSWKHIKTNMFLHRNRKNQPIDEIMVCHCKPPLDGRMGCQDECLNRMLNIECVKGSCPCGEFCSNQQFQKRDYSQLKCFPSGKKGFGLQLLEDIPKGRFLIEYVGEVLDMSAYEARQREYASKGHKHFYFMTLNGSEVIDACAKGNLGRFINHSCEPNCCTEKWMVNGEVCIGLFALRNIKKGEELTFDYNYVRVFGAAAKKCVCGSSRCRGVIGGDSDSLNGETIVLGDSDDEYPEPVTSYENNNVENVKSPDSLLVMDEKNDELAIPIESTEREVSFERSSSATSASESKTEHTEGLSPSCVQPLNTYSRVVNSKSEKLETPVNLLPDVCDSKKKPKSHTNGKKCTILKPKSRAKLPVPSPVVKRGKLKTDSRPPIVSHKIKKIVEDNLTGRFEGVEQALETLQNKDKGISKRRDAWKGYLKLLCLTANAGNGEGIQSNRDLSMILGALLLTKSRTVLLDIINKNGLQLLHNLMKRYRKVFTKTPILRKLLKVLEFLAETKILTLEHILKPSPAGVESFKESILSLTEHEDKEVHQIARNFRDRYIPWYARKVNRPDRDIGRMEFHPSSNFKSQYSERERRPSEFSDNCIKQSLNGHTPSLGGKTLEGSSASCLSSCTDGTRTRKRKSRWDQPGDIDSPSNKQFRSNNDVCHTIPEKSQTNDDDVDVDMDGDAPPGFSSPVNCQLFPRTSATANRCKVVVTGQPQDRYNSRLPTSFGIPCSVLKKLRTPESASSGSWIVAPAMTFHCFPPLPSYPRHVKNQQLWRSCTNPTRNFSNYGPGPFNQPNSQRYRNPNTLGKRYFKQQKWNNNSRPNLPWYPNKYGPSGFNGPNHPNIGVRYGRNEGNGSCGNGFYQSPPPPPPPPPQPQPPHH